MGNEDEIKNELREKLREEFDVIHKLILSLEKTNIDETEVFVKAQTELTKTIMFLK